MVLTENVTYVVWREAEMIKYVILDVDGTLTDAGIYYDDTGNELKKFCTKDAVGILAAKAAGIMVIVLTGRECKATTRRLKELGVTELHQGIKDKFTWMKEWMKKNRIGSEDVGYIGDDLNDLRPMELCGYKGCPKDSCMEVTKIVDYISDISGGHGAVRDVIEHYLKEQGLWDQLVKRIYGAGY